MGRQLILFTRVRVSCINWFRLLFTLVRKFGESVLVGAIYIRLKVLREGL